MPDIPITYLPVGLKQSVTSPRKQRYLTQQVVKMNILIFSLAVSAPYTKIPGLLGGLLIILYLTVKALSSPIQIFYMTFGIKLTFDALWIIRNIPLPGFGKFSMLELFFIPFIVVIIHGFKQVKLFSQWYIKIAFLLLLWSILAALFNDRIPSIQIVIRQGSMFIGLLIGLRYLKDREHLDLMMKFVFISTIIPVLALFSQFILSQIGIAVFYFTQDNVRGIRLSGLYYDAATAGMAIIISIISNAYLLHVKVIDNRYRLFYIAFFVISVICIILGGTRSMMFTAFLIIIVLFLKNLKQILALTPVFLIIVFLFKPYIDKVILRTTKEISFSQKLNITEIEVAEILENKRYKYLFSGRIGLWQNVWKQVKSSSFFQQLLGTGKYSNPHSSYFYLLLQIGFLGLAVYIFFHIFLFIHLIKKKSIDPTLKSIGILLLLGAVLLGISTDVVVYTSFQWLVYLMAGGIINTSVTNKMRKRPRIVSRV